MTKNTITVFKGDGIGPEITDAVLEILEKAGANLAYEIFNVGEAEYERNGALIPAAGLASFEKTHVLLKSPITTPVGKGFRSLNVTLRTKYDLYANIRPAKSNEAVRTPFPHVDLITFRENTEDLYVGVEEEAHGRKKVTCVHKANIMKLSDGLFRSVFYEVAKEFPAIEADDKMVDAVCMMLVMHPENFDIMVMPNLYGDIVSDLTSGLIGGLGLLPSSNIGDRLAMFEAVHGSAPDIAGKGIANPTAFLWSACMMLEHLDDNETAARIRRAVDATLKEAKSLTPDLGGTATTHEYTKAIVEKL